MSMRFGIAVVVALALTGCGTGGASMRDCPSEAQVAASIQKHIDTVDWNETQRSTWKVNSVSGFAFGPMKTGRIVQKQVEYGRSAQDVCPVRIDYTYKIAHADGRVEDKAVKDTTFLFYRNAFDEWVFKTG